MSKEPICPSTIDGIKRYAKQLKASSGLKHAEALDLAARAGGFQNYVHARKKMGGDGTPAVPTGYQAFVTVSWRVRETKERGRETLSVWLDTPLDQLVKPAHLKEARHFSGMRFAGPDHIEQQYFAGSQSSARHQACAAARTLVFMQATGLRPSSSQSRAYPGGRFSAAVPGHDHASIWYDHAAKAFVFVDEPYAGAADGISEERVEWARQHGWHILKPKWRGMYNPDGGCELYLAADGAKGYSLDRIAAALDRLPLPIVEADWDGESVPAFSPFHSPGEKAKAEAQALAKAARRSVPRKSSDRASVRYRTMLGGERSRPAARMPINAHAEVGKLLKSVLAKTYARRGVYNRINRVRSYLDDWAQCEYDRNELPDTRFFDLYYHEAHADSEGPPSPRRYVQNLERAKEVLIQHYPDGPPLRALLKSTDAAIKSLATWVT